MAFNFARLWPRAEVARLKHESQYLATALRNATDKAAESLSRLEEVRSTPCAACEVLKQTLNFHVLAAGSKIGVFDGIGPTLPPRAPQADVPPPDAETHIRASKLVKQQRRNFVDEFLKSEANQLEAEELHNN